MDDEEFEKWLATPIDELPESEQQVFREIDAMNEVWRAQRENDKLWRIIPGFLKYEIDVNGTIRHFVTKEVKEQGVLGLN